MNHYSRSFLLLKISKKLLMSFERSSSKCSNSLTDFTMTELCRAILWQYSWRREMQVEWPGHYGLLDTKQSAVRFKLPLAYWLILFWSAEFWSKISPVGLVLQTLWAWQFFKNSVTFLITKLRQNDGAGSPRSSESCLKVAVSKSHHFSPIHQAPWNCFLIDFLVHKILCITESV